VGGSQFNSNVLFVGTSALLVPAHKEHDTRAEWGAGIIHQADMHSKGS
jgi:hypothetical protein